MEAASTVIIHPRPAAPAAAPVKPNRRLPTLLQTPAGLALLELQGNFNFPSDGGDAMVTDEDESGESSEPEKGPAVYIGRLDFPEYDPAAAESAAWMRRVHLYVGAYQRLTGEVKKLLKPVAVVRRRQGASGDSSSSDLEVVEVVHYKLLFSQRPEPRTTSE